MWCLVRTAKSLSEPPCLVLRGDWPFLFALNPILVRLPLAHPFTWTTWDADKNPKNLSLLEHTHMGLNLLIILGLI